MKFLCCLVPFAVLLVTLYPIDVSAQGIFASYDVLTLQLEAPFDELFARARRQPDYAVEGMLTDPTRNGDARPIPVRISLRGHTSRRDSECSFPKLKVQLPEDADRERFGRHRTLKIGTHCGETNDGSLTARFGRLANERSPWREATVYRLLDALRVPALRARPVRMSYIFVDSDERGRTPLVRNGMILEDEDDAAERLGGGKEITADTFTTADQLFAVEDASTLAFAQALIGNFDWCIRFSANDRYRCDARMKLWNVIAFAGSDGKARPVMHDFDVSGMVTGSHRWFEDVFNPAFVKDGSPREVEVIAQLQRTRTLFSRHDLDAARRRFLSRRREAARALDEAALDAEGRRQMREYLDAFYREIESDDRFYRPVITQSNVVLRSDTPDRAPICTTRGPAPAGTPVTAPIETRGDSIKVVVLDALWHWAPPAKCPAAHRGAVWIPANAVGRNFPE